MTLHDRRPPPRRQRLLIIGGIAALIVLLAASMTPRGMSSWEEARFAQLAIVAAACAFFLAASRRRLSHMAMQAAIWLLLGAILLVGYSYRDDINAVLGRTAGTLVPARGVEVAPGVMRFTADDSGQFYIDAKVDGVAIHFLVDTGASGIALSQRDAERLGLKSDDLAYTARFSTANGTVRAAPVRLGSLAIGPFETTDIPAWVNEGELSDSLLGMSYLSTLGRIEIKGDTLTLERAR